MDWQRGTIPYYHLPEGYIPEEEFRGKKEPEEDGDLVETLKKLNTITES